MQAKSEVFCGAGGNSSTAGRLCLVCGLSTLQDMRQRPGDRHKVGRTRKSTARPKSQPGVIAQKRPPSHSTKRADCPDPKRSFGIGTWAAAKQQLSALNEQVKVLAVEQSDLHKELCWERTRRIALEGAQAAEKAVLRSMQAARQLIRTRQKQGHIPLAFARELAAFLGSSA